MKNSKLMSAKEIPSTPHQKGLLVLSIVKQQVLHCLHPCPLEPNYGQSIFSCLRLNLPGPGCSKLTTLLVNISFSFQKLISQICQYFLLKKCEKPKTFSHFINKKFECIGYKVIKHLS